MVIFRRSADEHRRILKVPQPLTHSGMTVIGVTLVIDI
ncbi:MAG: hypothetical protein PG978_001320 [Wolbachia endosymbiont of Ctenocephalides felis wCfeF]|nr:MAG: hypothetical protein PG978_001320 [Wolbachia endosymbiont of Ctenocephalides felis wCfeF]